MKLARASELLPGIILLEDGDLVREEQLRVLRVVVAALQGEVDMVNRVLRVWADRADRRPRSTGWARRSSLNREHALDSSQQGRRLDFDDEPHRVVVDAEIVME